MVQPLGFKPKFANSFMAVYSAYLINFTIPRAGELARASILTNYEKVPFDKGIGTIVAERIADTLMLLLVITIALFLEFDFIYKFLTDKFNLATLVLGGLGLVIGAIVAIFFLKKVLTNWF